MRLLIVVFYSLICMSASANDSIQVWYEHFYQALNNQQYKDAEISINKILSQWQQENAKVDGSYITLLYYKLITLCANHKYIEADEILHIIEDNWELTGMSKESEMYALLLENKSFIMDGKGAHTDPILTPLLESLAIYEKISEKRSIHNIPTLMRIALLYGDKGNYIKSLEYKEEAISISRKYLKPDDKNLSVYLLELSDSYSVVGDYRKALEAAEEAKSIIESQYKDDRLLYARSMLSLSLCYSDLCNFSKAIVLCNKAIGVSKERGNNTVLRSSYDGLSRIYFAMGKYQEALDNSLKALEISETIGEYGSDAYMTILNNLSILYNNLAEYDKAIELQEKSLARIINKHGGASVNYATGLSNLASTYFNRGDFFKALDLYKQSYEIREASNDYVGCITSLDGISLLFEELGELPKALKYSKEAMEYCERIFGRDNPMYARCLSHLAGVYGSCGNADRAIEYELQSLKIRERLLGNKHPDYSKSLDNLATYYYSLNKYEKAIEYCEISLNITDSIYGQQNPQYAVSLGNLSEYIACNGQIERAIQLREKAMSINHKYYGEQSIYYAIDLENMANYLSSIGKYEQATRNYMAALDIFKKMVGKNHPDYIQALENLSSCLEAQGIYRDALYYREESISRRRMEALRTLPDMTEENRESFWTTIKSKFLTSYPRLLYYYNTNDYSQLYNAILFSKGILLNANIQLFRLISESGDSILINEYMKLKNDRSIINKISSNLYGFQPMNVLDSLQKVVEERELLIVNKVKEYGDFTKNVNAQWTEIKEKLSEEEISIEFLRIPIKNDSVMYAALTLRKDDKSPKLVTLFEEKQLKNISDTLCYQSEDMARLVWGPLFPELQGVKNIYFSPSGALYNIGIEYLPGMEDYNIYRLSSTRELVNKRDINENNHAVLYGGLDYDAKLHTLSQSESRARFDEKFVDHSDVRSMKYRGGQEKLTHTLDEVEQIERELNNNQWVCLLDTLSLGTEESFKSLSGTKINTLHIATHGFYYTPEESDNIGYSFLLPNNQMSAEDKSLSRSGLLMSGANHILDGDSIPEDVEDGILTAKEIADVDLQGLDLVVLSACQTGLGDISQGEGVFGLQRGFKKAGANSILMSLWEVNDEATQILMTQFYKNLVSGRSKRQSLRSAQKYLRKYNRGQFDKPEYWAAFILLDGLEKN